MRRLIAGTAALVVLALMVSACAASEPRSPQRAQQAAAGVTGFTFAAAGDHGANSHTAAALSRIDGSAASFYLALGDLDYDQTPSDAAWCDYVKSHLPTKGAEFPFELVVGNHEQDGGPDGRIANFAACLPDRLGSRIGPGAQYGAEYSFTFPAQNPLAKVIMIAPRMTVGGEYYSYAAGTDHRAWLVRQIRRAREAGIPWVVVGMHYTCLTTGVHGCDAGSAILNLLVQKKVDLVITGHNHIYERGKQLRLNSSTCPRIKPGVFDRDCVVPGWRDGVYAKGAGTTFVTAGTFGAERGYTKDDSEARYFARRAGWLYGFTKYSVTADRIIERYINTDGTFSDSFRIAR